MMPTSQRTTLFTPIATPALVYTTGGTVQVGGGVYLPRQADRDLLQTCRSGIFAYVLASRQTGKSSLMTQTATQLRAEGIQVVVIDLQALGVQLTAAEWYLGLLVEIADKLPLATDVIEWWERHGHLGLSHRFTQFFEKVLLAEVGGQVVIFIDEIDTVLSLNFTDDLFVAIRYFQVERAQNPAFERLSFVLLGVATPADLIADSKRTPFNVGQRIELNDFTFTEALPLAGGLGLPDPEARQVLQWVLAWTRGHPYLTQRLYSVLSQQQKVSWSKGAIDQVVAATFFGPMSNQDNNLLFVHDILTRRAPDLKAVLTTYEAIWRNQVVVDEEQSIVKSHLKLSGIVQREGDRLTVRNPIYQRVFNRAWVREHLPDTWWDRMKPALPLLLTLLAFSVAMSGVSVYAFKQRDKAQQQAQIALGLRLSSLAQVLQQQQSDIRSLLVAIEASRRLQKMGIVPEDANAVLQQGLEQMTPRSGRQIPQPSAVSAIAFSPDGHFIAAAAEDKAVRLFTVETGQLVQEIPHSSPVRTIAFSSDGNYLATGDEQAVQLFAVGTYQRVARIPHQGFFSRLVFSPDNRYLATASWNDPTVKVLAIATGQVLASIPDSRRVYDLAFSPDGNFLAIAAKESVQVLTLSTGQRVQLPHQQAVYSVAFSPKGGFLVTAGEANQAQVFAILQGRRDANANGQFQPIATLPHADAVRSLAFSPDGRYLATGSDDNTVRLFDAATHQLLEQFPQAGRVYQVAFSPNSQYLATASSDRTVGLYDIPARRTVTRMAHEGWFAAIAFSPDSRFLATIRDQAINLTATNIHQPFAPLRHDDRVYGLAFSPDSQSLATASAGKTTRVFATTTGQTQLTLPYPSRAVDFSPDGEWLVVASEGTAHLINLKTEQTQGPIAHPGDILWVAFSPNGQYVATASEDKTAQVVALRTGETVARVTHVGPVYRVAFSPDSQFLATVGFDKTVQLTAIPTGKPVARIPHENGVWFVAFSPDGQYLATAGGDKAIRLIAVRTGEIVSQWSQPGRVWSLAFSHDGRYLAAASDDSVVRLIAVATGKVVDRFPHEGNVWSIAFSPNDRYLATASFKTARLIAVATGKTVTRISHDQQIYQVAFSPNGQYLATASEDKTVQLSLVDPDAVIDKICAWLPRNLTRSEWQDYFSSEPYQPTCPNLPLEAPPPPEKKWPS